MEPLYCGHPRAKILRQKNKNKNKNIITEVHQTSVICTLEPIKVAFIGDCHTEGPYCRGSTVLVMTIEGSVLMLITRGYPFTVIHYRNPTFSAVEQWSDLGAANSHDGPTG